MSFVRVYYHTQEKRTHRLDSPMLSFREDAWLGVAFYFWLDIEFATYWGVKSKHNTGFYEIYRAKIDTENILDTVFNELHYRFWIGMIEKIVQKFSPSSKPSISDINEYLRDKGIMRDFTGVQFQDIPQNELFTAVKSFYYRKRIQLAVYEPDIIHNFDFYSETPI